MHLFSISFFLPARASEQGNVIGLVSICVVTPHAQRERGKVIDRGVRIIIYICLWSKKKFESYFRDRLTFLNANSRTSR